MPHQHPTEGSRLERACSSDAALGIMLLIIAILALIAVYRNEPPPAPAPPPAVVMPV